MLLNIKLLFFLTLAMLHYCEVWGCQRNLFQRIVIYHELTNRSWSLWFQPPSLLIGKVWVPVMHYSLHCRVLWRVHMRLGSCRLISVKPLRGSTIRAFSIRSSVWVLEVLCCLYWHSFYLTDHITLWWIVVGVNWLTLYQECRRAVFWANYCSSCALRSFFPFWKITW